MIDQIPPATAEKLAANWPKGTRHQAAKTIAIPLIGNGMPPQAVFATLRAKFESDVTDKELQDIVDWASRQVIEPCASTFSNFVGYRNVPSLALNKPVMARTPTEQVDWWTSGNRVEPSEVMGASPVKIPDSPADACTLALSSLYRETDNLNIVCRYITTDEKARPSGAGKVLSRDGWVEWIGANGIPQSEAGAWFRFNPCAPVGTGKEGAITDADVASFRFALLESDCLPLPQQLALFRRLRLPIAAIILSGSKSAHAWVRVEAADQRKFDELVKRLFSALKPFGIDQANSNPSRLSRLPGAKRVIGSAGDGMQRLLWLNPTCQPLAYDDLARFEETLKWPAIEEKPLRALAQSSIERWNALYANQGKLGVPFGIPALDEISGGIKAGQTVVIAGESGGGKSTYALHVIKSALTAGYGVALFSLEMDQEEVFDLIVSDRCSIDRNKFNNGRFNEHFDFPRMSQELPTLASLPLFIEDNATVGPEDIRARVMQLKADNKIGLVVVDYVQFVDPGLTKESREQQVARISHSLRTLARESKLPFVILSQLNDEGKLRESRVIAHNANVVALIQIEGDNVTIKIVKGRGIPTGDYALSFNRMFARLEAKEQHEHTETTD